MKIAILEYICGSGNFRAPSSGSAQRGSAQRGSAQRGSAQHGSSNALSADSQSASLLGEGFAMLHALGSDLIASGIELHSVVEPSILDWATEKGFDLRGWHIEKDRHDSEPSLQQTATRWVECARHCDATIVIAPELDGALVSLVESLRASGIQVIASSREFLETTSDKWLTSRRWLASGVRHPRTWLLSDWLKDPPQLESVQGWVVKRRDSAGAVDLRRFQNASALVDHALGCDPRWQERDRWIVQPWVSGQPASIGILAGGTKHHVLGALEQHFHPSGPHSTGLAYCGGSGPLKNAPLERLEPFVERALAAIPGQSAGWIGIDFLIEPDDQWTLIEVNARVTSSYLGYRQLYGDQLALALLRGEPPHQDLAPNATCCFTVGDFRG